MIDLGNRMGQTNGRQMGAPRPLVRIPQVSEDP